ncbi:MAG: hypothetical protein M1820_005961 [Bogoriella megaspora]|nr:MAG: hypothetical protein M1820_005961 [Bogoriella megaspora]
MVSASKPILLDLPPEIRDNIYRLAIPDAEEYDRPGTSFWDLPYELQDKICEYTHPGAQVRHKRDIPFKQALKDLQVWGLPRACRQIHDEFFNACRRFARRHVFVLPLVVHRGYGDLGPILYFLRSFESVCTGTSTLHMKIKIISAEKFGPNALEIFHPGSLKKFYRCLMRISTNVPNLRVEFVNKERIAIPAALEFGDVGISLKRAAGKLRNSSRRPRCGVKVKRVISYETFSTADPTNQNSVRSFKLESPEVSYEAGSTTIRLGYNYVHPAGEAFFHFWHEGLYRQ